MVDPKEAASRWATTWTAAWQAHDVKPVVALYADDCVHRSTPFRPPHRGRQAVRDYVTQAFADERRIDDVRFGAPVVEGDRACVEYWARFLDRHGTAMTLAGCAVARFDADGRPIAGPPTEPLAVLEHKVENGNLQVFLFT